MYMYLFEHMDVCEYKLTIFKLIRYYNGDKLETIWICLVCRVHTNNTSTVLPEHFSLELCHDYQQEVVSTELWVSLIFNSLWFVCNDWRWLLLFQLLHKAINRECVIFVPMFQGVVHFTNDIPRVLSCYKSSSSSFGLKMVTMVTVYQ